ncbi:MAG: cytochrome P450 [Gammaproteobacteria bacterium]|nr:MAG: cytochrome P450 [Chloroflexota bacterium]TDJ22869.1 MAG: cytochrome P450 [Gammaproteobacteria bacterium]TDJ40713.1 MAG: cytochrome P450 [Gammaproteobacteria bacterium]
MSEMQPVEGALLPDPYSLPLDTLNVAQPALFQQDAHWAYFERLRKEDPVHFCAESMFGPYWSVTKFNDIMYVDTHHEVFSSEGGITVGPPPTDTPPEDQFRTPMFIAMDPPKHDVQRATVQPVVAPLNLVKFESTIRERAAKVLDELPVGETFDWVDRVSIELTTQMLATLFDFPFEDRRKLTRWSDVATGGPDSGVVESMEQRRTELLECLEVFTEIWHERAASPPGEDIDLISMLAHGESTKDMINRPMEYLGNLILLIVGGNDTTRNSISGGVLALNQNPDQYQMLRDDPGLIPNMVPEIIRWQTPLAHMRRVALEDTELGGKQIKAGERVVMWYVSGNRDEEVIDQPNAFIIDRPKARKHLAFGFGIHRCMGNRLAEMQLRVVWEEIMKRFHMVEVVGEPQRTLSCFVKGYTHLPVKLHPLK